MIDYLTDKYFRVEKRVKKLFLWFSLVHSRHTAHQDRKKIIRRKGKSVVTREVKKTIKQYARERFGSGSYWPYLAYYAEIRGQFMEGWIPDDYFTHVLEPKINPRIYGNISGIKTYDHRLFGDFAIRPLLLVISGLFYDADLNVLDENQLNLILSDHNDDVVLKEEFGFGGKQVRMMHSSEFTPKVLNKGMNYVIQPYFRQHKILSDLYPHSVNTFRVTTLLKKDGSVDVKFVILRFGVDGKRVDNLSSGGQCIYIYPEGKPDRIAYDYLSIPMGETHQNTGFRFSDLEIPMYWEILESCRTAHKKFPYVRVIGWDVCVDEQGKPKLLEWNGYHATYAIEDALFGPFSTNDPEFSVKRES